MHYSTNVFINCPFDDDYYLILKPLLFTIIFCGLKPRLSETNDSSDIRIEKIQQLIEECKYSIHDISRIIPIIPTDLPRFNMPFELGLDIGCKKYYKKDKKCLILEEQPYRYKKVISDISGQDISNHNNDPLEITKVIRNWIYKIRTSKKTKKLHYNLGPLQ